MTLRHPLLVSVVTDPELTRSSVQIVRKQRPGWTTGASPTTGASLVERLVQMMLDDRFGELSRKPDAKFLGASSGTDSISPAVDSFVARRPGAGREDRRCGCGAGDRDQACARVRVHGVGARPGEEVP